MNLNPATWFGDRSEEKGAVTAPYLNLNNLPPALDWVTYKSRLTPKDYVNLFRDTAFYCANLNARGVARTKLCMYKKRGTGQSPARASRKAGRITAARVKAAGYAGADDTIEEIEAHPFLDLLDKPYYADGVPQMGRFTLLEITQLYLEIVGRSYWEIDSGGVENGPPSQIFPLIAYHVDPWQNLGSAKFVDEYRYYVGPKFRQIPPNEIVPFLCPSLTNPYTGGYSPMMAAADRVGVSLSYLSQSQSFLNNRARPDMLIAPAAKEGAVIAEPTMKRLRKWFSQQFQRIGIGRPLIVNEPIEVHPLQFNLKDLGELREEEQAIKQVARCFDIPLSMLDKDANLASAGEGRKQHANDAISPRHRRLEHSMNAQLVSRYDPSGQTFVMFDEPYHEALAPEAKDLPALVNSVLMPDEVREMMGYGPMPEEFKAELEQRRQDELNAAKPPMKPGGKEPASANQSKSVLAIRQRIRAGKVVSLNGHRH